MTMKDETLHAQFQLLQRFDRPVGTKWDNTQPIYVEEDLKAALEDRYRELVYQRLESDDPVPLRYLDFYPAVVRAALNGTSIEEELTIHPLLKLSDVDSNNREEGCHQSG